MSSAPASSAFDPGLVLEARDIVRRYPGNVALKKVTFRAYRNCINVLIGENGAGKSTLMRILAGVEEPDEGQILISGEPVRIRSPKDASALGIAIVHQELAVLPTLDVSENIFAGRELLKGGTMINRADEDRRSSSALQRLRNPLPVNTSAELLSLGSRQIVELARAITHDTRLLILDEPTSALSAPEAESLFHVLEEMKSAGVTIIYISHRLYELMYLGDRFTVLRSGEIVGEGSRGQVTRAWIVERMSGRAEVDHFDRTASTVDRPIALRTDGITISPLFAGEQAQSPVYDVSLTVHRGEILGIYGLLGAGRTELLEALSGARRMASGAIYVNGRQVRLHDVRDAVKAGIALVPEDRQRDGLIPELSVRENIALMAAKGPVISKERETQRVRELVKQLGIVVKDIELPIGSVSGGNQQKVLLARCLMSSPIVLLLDEPTRGVDVGTRADIYRRLRELADAGLSILFTSSEIEETRLLADRALVMCQGRISAEFFRDGFTDEMLFAAASPRVSSALIVSPETNV
jgi:erythritol transport system ATP-binding protein